MESNPRFLCMKLRKFIFMDRTDIVFGLDGLFISGRCNKNKQSDFNSRHDLEILLM